MNGLLQDFRYALRRLGANPGFAAVAAITLALGVGANTAIFNLVDTLVLRPIPVQNPHELTFLTFPRGAANFEAAFSAAEFWEISDHTREVFSGVAAFIFGGTAEPSSKPDGLTVDGETKPIQTVFVSGNFFNMLGIHPYKGRFILPSEGNAPGADPVAVLSYRYWKSRFNGDPSIVNKQVLINGRPVTIVGIAPKGFFGPTPIVDMEAYLPLGMMAVETEGKTDFLNDPRVRYLVVLGRLATGMTIERADASLAALHFSEGDRQVSPPVALINQAMAERFWPGKDPIGRQFIREGDTQHPVEVVGIVRNSRIEDAYSPYGPVFYVPISQNYVSAQTLQVRTAGLPQAVTGEILEVVRSLAPTMPVLSVRTMTDAVNGINGLFLFSLGARLTGGLGLLGLTLALVGIYGVMAYTAGQRTQEIGVRIALGAGRPEIFWMICRQGLVIIAIGLALGSALAVGIGRVVGDFLVGVRPTDPFTYLGVCLLLTLAALLACYIPARRAAKVDPMVALRYE